MDINLSSQIKLFANLSSFPLTGEVKTLYIDQATANHYYWSGSAYVQLKDGTKFPTPTGTTSQYLRGDGSLETFPTIPNPANFVAKADYTSHSILAKQSGGSDPVAVSIGTNEILGRKSGGGSNIEGLSVSEVKSLLNYTASDVGAPSGSGSSSGTNTGDETQASILSKLKLFKLNFSPSSIVTGTLTETQVGVVTIPPNSFSSLDQLKIYTPVSKVDVSLGTATIRLKLSTSATMPTGTTDLIGTYLMSAGQRYAPFERVGSINGSDFSVFNVNNNNNIREIQLGTANSVITYDFSQTLYLYVSLTLSNTADQSSLIGGFATNF
jgi:hypothetical protein